MRPIRYEPYSEIAGRPNVVVDGAPMPGTVLTLSHWPGTPTPVHLQCDLSAESAFRWRQRPGRWPGADLVTTDHLDQDGLVSLLALVNPQAGRWRDRLVEVARAGDFATFTDRGAARVSFALAALADPERSPLPPVTLADPGALTAELLGRLPELVEDPDRQAGHWAEEDAALAASEALVASGEVSIEEVPELDLAVVTVAEGAPGRLATRFMGRADAPCHPAAIHNATGCGRILIRHGARYQLVLRYESWVRVVSRRIAPRVDLAPLASALQAEESASNSARWSSQPVSTLVPCLSNYGSGETGLTHSRVRELVELHLRSAPPAWFPMSPGRPSLPPV